MQDPLSTFYEALSVGFNEPDFTNDFLQFPPQVAGGSNQVGLMKIPLAMQVSIYISTSFDDVEDSCFISFVQFDV